MKYWSYFLAKAALAGALIWIVGGLIAYSFPAEVTIANTPQPPFAHDVGYTAVMMLYFLFSSGVLYLVIWDQRYRCRTCLRRLRMPMAAGSWPNMFLKGQPRMEYICIYGHGTLRVPEVDLTGSKSPDWKTHENIWRELESLEESKR